MSDQTSTPQTSQKKRYAGCGLMILSVLLLISIPFLFLFDMAYGMAAGSSPSSPADAGTFNLLAIASMIGLVLAPIIGLAAGIWGGALWFRNAPGKS
jgi:hypothetical protein